MLPLGDIASNAIDQF